MFSSFNLSFSTVHKNHPNNFLLLFQLKEKGPCGRCKIIRALGVLMSSDLVLAKKIILCNFLLKKKKKPILHPKKLLLSILPTHLTIHLYTPNIPFLMFTYNIIK